MRARFAQLDARINELGDRASVKLRAERDELAEQLEDIDEQGEIAWDRFRDQVERSFTEIERELRGY